MKKVLFSLTLLTGIAAAGAAFAQPVWVLAPPPGYAPAGYGPAGYGYGEGYAPVDDWRAREWRHHEWERHRRWEEWRHEHYGRGERW